VNVDPFEILGTEPAFELDLAALERRHRELSRALHPDRHAGKSAAERRLALGRAIEVNQAWRTLKDPVRRAEALLARLGVGHGEGEEPKPDPELLMDMMELRERLGEARQSQDARALASLVAEVRAREERLLGVLASRFAELVPARSALSAGELLRLLGELRYTRRFLEEAAAIEDELP
jgi:molecular chaperone HscB